MAENKPVFVADASVIVKWAINEKEDLERALALKKDFVEDMIDIIVPTCCLPEVCNILCRQHPGMAVSFLSYLLESEILEHHLNLDLAGIAYRLTQRHRRISFYDALYHALAIKEKAIFLTADNKYFKQAHKEGSIMLLKDYGKK